MLTSRASTLFVCKRRTTSQRLTVHLIGGRWCNPGSRHAESVMIAVHFFDYRTIDGGEQGCLPATVSNRRSASSSSSRCWPACYHLSLRSVSGHYDRLEFLQHHESSSSPRRSPPVSLCSVTSTRQQASSILWKVELPRVMSTPSLGIVPRQHSISAATGSTGNTFPTGRLRRQLGHRSRRLDYCFVRCAHGVPLDHQECSLQPTRVALCPQDEDRLTDHVWVVTKLQFAATYKLPTSEWRAAPDTGVREDPEVFLQHVSCGKELPQEFRH